MKRYFLKKEFIKQNDYLLFSSIGERRHAYKMWADINKEYDIVTYFYGDDSNMINKNNIDVFINHKGLKLDNFYHYYINYKELVLSYKVVWIVDDDIEISSSDINKMFKTFDKNNLVYGGPSFTKNSFITCCKNKKYNNTNGDYINTEFIEIGIPLFSTKILPEIIEYFKDSYSGFGIEYLFYKKLKKYKNKIGLLHNIICNHPHPDLNCNTYKNINLLCNCDIFNSSSEINKILPRHSHRSYGMKLLNKYNVNENEWTIFMNKYA